jgi:hypothetical protein
MRITVRQAILAILALLALLLARHASAKTLKPKDVKQAQIGRIIRARGVVCRRFLDAGQWTLKVCESRKQRDCFFVRWHQYIVPDVGQTIEVEGERIR